MRTRLLLIALAALACLATGASTTNAHPDARAEHVLTVSCGDANLRVAPADADSGGYRIVLGAVSMPPLYIRQVARTGERAWPYWTKSGVSIEAGTPMVRISVPEAYRKSVAIEWGLLGPVSAQRFAPCAPPPTYWNGYVGGIFLKRRSACIPLKIQIGNETTTIRFGIGRHCP